MSGAYSGEHKLNGFNAHDEAELEMLYTHLSNGLMHVVVEGYEKYSKDETIRFVSRVVKASLSLFR